MQICSHGVQFPSQHFRLHLCLPQFLILLHLLSHINSMLQARIFSNWPHLHLFLTSWRHYFWKKYIKIIINILSFLILKLTVSQGPLWHLLWHLWIPQSSSLSHVSPHGGISSVQGFWLCVFPHGHVLFKLFGHSPNFSY